jgi:uncharacterized protein YndB with AHSA1/START domain
MDPNPRPAQRQIVVNAAPQKCFDSLTDFATYPDWQEPVITCVVHTLDRRGRGRRVSFEMDAKLQSISYTLEYSYEEPHLVAWQLVEGDLDEVVGEFVLEDRGDGTTLATHVLRLVAGRSVPSRVASMLGEAMTRRSVEDLKARAERAP